MTTPRLCSGCGRPEDGVEFDARVLGTLILCKWCGFRLDDPDAHNDPQEAP